METTTKPETVRQMLDVLDKFLAESKRDEALALWSILTALRGPDNTDRYRLKHTTTAVIRAVALPLAAKQERLGNVNFELTLEQVCTSGFIAAAFVYGPHFGEHISDALVALKQQL